MTEREFTSIRISHELHSKLRKYCDHCGIRVIDFVESALEEALFSEPVTESLMGRIEKLEKKAVTYDYAFNRGFRQGFTFYYLMSTGQGIAPDAYEDLNLVKKSSSTTLPKQQLGLFPM
jgi:hypothetical protein